MKLHHPPKVALALARLDEERRGAWRGGGGGGGGEPAGENRGGEGGSRVRVVGLLEKGIYLGRNPLKWAQNTINPNCYDLGPSLYHFMIYSPNMQLELSKKSIDLHQLS